MELAILFWFYKEAHVCANRLKILRRDNPEIKIFGLFGGDKSEAGKYQAGLRKYLDDFYASPFEDGKGPRRAKIPLKNKWKWLNGDLVLLDWYDKKGKSLTWDSIVVIQWDNLVFGPLIEIFSGIKKGGIFLFGLKELDGNMENTWAHVKGEDDRARYLHFRQYVKDQYGYSDKLLCCFFALEVFPRVFFEKYLTVKDRELGMIEYRVPVYAKIFNIPFYRGDLGRDIALGYNPDGPIRFYDEIGDSYIREQLKKKCGYRIFHPYSGIWGFSFYKLTPQYYLGRLLKSVYGILPGRIKATGFIQSIRAMLKGTWPRV